MITAIANHKGGTGKTTTTLNLGAALAKCGQKVLLVDLDFQGSLSYSLGINRPEKTLVDVFTNECGAEDVLIDLGDLFLIPADEGLADLEPFLKEKQNRQYFLRNALAGLEKKFDYILIDSPPSLSLVTVNGLCAAHDVIIPIQTEALSIRGLNQVLSTIEIVRDEYNSNLSIRGILPVMVDKRRKISSEILEYIRENYDLPIFENHIRSNVKISESPSFAQHIYDYAPTSPGAEDYLRLAKELRSVEVEG